MRKAGRHPRPSPWRVTRAGRRIPTAALSQRAKTQHVHVVFDDCRCAHVQYTVELYVPDPCLAMPACCPLFDSNSTSYIHTCILSSRPRSSAVGPTLHPPINGLMLSWPSPKTESAAGFSTVGENGHVLEESIARDTMMCHFGSSRASMVKRQIHYTGSYTDAPKNSRGPFVLLGSFTTAKPNSKRSATGPRVVATFWPDG